MWIDCLGYVSAVDWACTISSDNDVKKDPLIVNATIVAAGMIVFAEKEICHPSFELSTILRIIWIRVEGSVAIYYRRECFY